MGRWHTIKLIRLAEFINGYGFKPDDWSKEGLPIIRIEQLKNPLAQHDYYSGKLPESNIIDNGDLIFSWSASLFLRIWDRGKAALNQHLFKVIPNVETDILFLKYLIEYNLDKLLLSAHGSTMQHITRKELEKFDVFIPEDKPEQTRIAQILSKADAAITQTEALISKYQCIKTGLMQDLLTKGIDEHGNIRSKATHRFVVKNGIEVPEEWEVRELGTLCEMKGRIGWQGYTVNDLSDDASEPTVIGGTQISKEHKLDFSKPVYLKRQKYLEAPEIFVKFGDIVLVKTGNTIGKTALVDKQIGEATINPNTVILRDFKDITNRFLYLVMISEYFQKSLWDFVFVGAQPSVNQTNMKTIKIPLPNPGEQIKIAGAFFALTNQIEDERVKLAKLQSLKTGLMQDLLSGKVRVKIK